MLRLYEILKTKMVPLLGVFLLFVFLVLPMTNDYLNDMQTPDPMFSYSQEEIVKIAENLGDEGRSHYIYSRVFMDILWPIVYACTFYMLLSMAFKDTKVMGVIVLPFVGMLLDFLENVIMMHQMNAYPNLNSTIINIGSAFTSLKWIVMVSVGIFIVIGIVFRLYGYINKAK